jgi:signal transduction histidine kinase
MEPGSSPKPDRELAEQLVELSSLTGGLAHEIRNPLSTLKVNLQLLDEELRRIEEPEGARRCDPLEIARRSRTRIATLLRETDRLEQILQDFLRYVGRRDLTRFPYDLNDLIRELAEFYRPQARAGGIEFEVACTDAPLICRVDPTYLKQAVLNLLINAQQAMPDGGHMRLAAIGVPPARARIEVVDSGPGIPAPQRTTIFDAYYSTRPGGTGLGLANARRIVREHGGSIDVEDAAPHGARFVIALDLADATAAPASAPQE